MNAEQVRRFPRGLMTRPVFREFPVCLRPHDIFIDCLIAVIEGDRFGITFAAEPSNNGGPAHMDQAVPLCFQGQGGGPENFTQYQKISNGAANQTR